MASIRKDKRSGRDLVCFRFRERQHQSALQTTNRKDALAQAARVSETIQLIERGRLELPPDVDPALFVLSDGRVTQSASQRPNLKLHELFDLYFETLPPGAKEPATIAGESIHTRHLLKHLCRTRIAQSITAAGLQQDSSQRAQDEWADKPISVDTVRKELATFRLIWNRAERQGHLTGRCPTRGITYPKRDAKPPFMTSSEIEKIIARGGLSEDQEQALWDCLFLDAVEVESLLDEVRQQAIQPFV